MIKPPKLKAGDTIGLCSPSGTIAHKKDLFEKAKKHYERSTGLSIVVGPNAFDQHYYSAGMPEARLSDFSTFVDDPTIKAIIFSAGGDTAIDLVESLPYNDIRQNPK